MWEIAENLHRAELTALEESEHISEWIKLAGVSSQTETKPQGGRPKSGVNAASRELGIDRADAHRAVKVDKLSPEAKQAARDAELDAPFELNQTIACHEGSALVGFFSAGTRRIAGEGEPMHRTAMSGAMLFVAFFAVGARADVISTFDASGTFADGATLSGEVTIDTTTGVVASGFFAASGIYDVSAPIIPANIVQTPDYYILNPYEVSFGSSQIFKIIIPTSTLVDYSGGMLASDQNDSFGIVSSYSYGSIPNLSGGADLSSGRLTLETFVPEPASWALLAFGLVGLGLAVRSRDPA